MIKNVLFYSFACLLSVSLFMTSCSEEADGTGSELVSDTEVSNFIDNTDLTAGTSSFGRGEKGDKDDSKGHCFELVYPISLEFEDGTLLEFSSEDEIKDVLRAYIEENGRPSTKPQLVFPIEILDSDGNSQTIANQEELEELKETCVGYYFGDKDDDDDEHDDDDDDDDDGRHHGHIGDDLVEEIFDNDCFTVVFPVSIALGTDDAVAYNDEDDIEDAVEDFLENGGTIADISISFPVNIVTAEGESVALNSLGEIQMLAFECLASYRDEEKCFEIVFPITLEFEDGTAIEIESADDKIRAIRDYIAENGRPNSTPELVFPVSVTLVSTGETVEVNDKEELYEIHESCDD